MLVGVASSYGHEGSTRDPPADPEAMWNRERKGHVGHPRNYPSLSRGRAPAGIQLMGQTQNYFSVGVTDALCVNLSYFCIYKVILTYSKTLTIPKSEREKNQ